MVERINSRKTDINNLLEKARELAGDDASLLEDLNERFNKLQTLAWKKHEQFRMLINRWKKMTEQRRRMMGMLKTTQFVANRKPIKSSKDARGELDKIEVNFAISLINGNKILSLITVNKSLFTNECELECDLHHVTYDYHERTLEINQVNKTIKPDQVR